MEFLTLWKYFWPLTVEQLLENQMFPSFFNVYIYFFRLTVLQIEIKAAVNLNIHVKARVIDSTLAAAFA